MHYVININIINTIFYVFTHFWNLVTILHLHHIFIYTSCISIQMLIVHMLIVVTLSYSISLKDIHSVIQILRILNALFSFQVSSGRFFRNKQGLLFIIQIVLKCFSNWILEVHLSGHAMRNKIMIQRPSR